MKKTNIKRHIRRTKKGPVIIKKHKRRVRDSYGGYNIEAIREKKRNHKMALPEGLDIIEKGKQRILVDEEGKKLASLKLNYDSKDAINISDWKAKVKGKSYGKELIKEIREDRPDLWFVSTDGLTEKGEKAIEKALPDFRVIDKRRGAAQLMRQDAVDYYIEEGEKGIRKIWRPNPKLHSKHEKDKR